MMESTGGNCSSPARPPKPFQAEQDLSGRLHSLNRLIWVGKQAAWLAEVASLLTDEGRVGEEAVDLLRSPTQEDLAESRRVIARLHNPVGRMMAAEWVSVEPLNLQAAQLREAQCAAEGALRRRLG